MSRIVVTADLHLGKTQFSSTTNGRNTRECDIEGAWASAVNVIVEQQPDLVLIGGDIFDRPRVGTYALMAWRNGVRRIVTETEACLIAIAGNHDVARTRQTMSPIIIPDDYDRVHIVVEPKRLRLTVASGEVVSVACFPFSVLVDPTKYMLAPDPEADVNCVLIHAAAQSSAEGVDALPRFYAGAEAIDIGREASRFDLIACGDYHTFHRLHPTALALYPGSLERTSSNIWAETAPKGLVLCDTEQRSLEFHEIETRAMFDWSMAEGDFKGYPLTAEGVNSALTTLTLLDVLDDAMVRLKVEDFPMEERHHIDWGMVNSLKKGALHHYLDIRYAKRDAVDLGDRRDRDGGISLADEAIAFFAEDDAEVRDCAFGYLEIEAAVEEVAS